MNTACVFTTTGMSKDSEIISFRKKLLRVFCKVARLLSHAERVSIFFEEKKIYFFCW